MYGINGTYKIFKEKFTLVAFGRLDMVRCYHPVSFMITNHECKEDYEYFYKSVAMITADFNIPLKICYIMQDASQSEYCGLRLVCPEAIVLSC